MNTPQTIPTPEAATLSGRQHDVTSDVKGTTKPNKLLI